MISPQGIFAVFRFEWRRSLTIPRMAWWTVLAAFPPLIVFLIQLSSGGDDPPDPNIWTFMFYVLVPGVVCMLGVFLWSTPAISSELEGKSWIYLAVRPDGSSSVLIGKYLVAVSWAMSAALTGLTIAILMAAPEEGFRMWSMMARLVMLSCVAYAAVYALIGVLFQKKGMMVAIAYTLIFEVLLAFVPAMINQFTIQLRLRSLMANWLDWHNQAGSPAKATPALFDNAPSSQHLLILLGLTAGVLIAAVCVLRYKELVTAADQQT